MHLTRMRLGGVPPFTEPVEFVFDERVNVFVGPNGVGKTNLLRAMKSATIQTSAIATGDEDPFSFVLEIGQDNRDISMENSADWGESRSLPWIFIPSVRSVLPSAYDMKQVRTLDDRNPMRFTRLIDDPYWFDCSAVVHTMLSQVRRGKFFMTPVQTAYWCAADICKEILPKRGQRNYLTKEGLPVPPGYPPTAYPERIFPGSDLIVPPVLFNGMGVDIADEDRTRLFFGDLSSGTQGILMWVWYVALRIQEFYQSSTPLQELPAILLIDEIENHLHPTWQRRVIPALLEHFPGLQIFATTHSPFVVAGLKAGQVHMLKRDADGVVTASTNEQDIIGWTTDEILRTFMGVDEPTDQLTIDRAERLRELRGKDALTDEEAAEMEELRRRVNEDFLSSVTPLGKERERLGEMMMDFLRSRQSDLSQDGD